METLRVMPRALTIAGSDSSGGAGIQQDLKTFQALGVWGMCAVTAVTVQDSTRVHAVQAIPAGMVAAQIEAVAADIGVDAAKTGMLARASTVDAVAAALRRAGIGRIVVDPVLVASTGQPLIPRAAVKTYRAALLPIATIVTPNAAEAAALAGMEAVSTRDDQIRAARLIHDETGATVLVTGGHVEPGAPEAVDVLCDEAGVVELRASRTPGEGAHGSGCLLSAAIAAGLARGLAVEESVRAAKEHVAGALAHAQVLGRGAASVDPGWHGRAAPRPADLDM